MIKIENIVRPNILNLKPYSSARDEFSGKEGIFLDANENPFGSLNRYPDPYQKEIKQKLSGLKNVDNNNIFIGNGSDEVIDLAFRIFCIPGTDKALTFSPTYGMYEVSANINNVELLKLPLKEEFQIDVENLSQYFNDDSIKLIFICSPNNPTGNTINNNDIEFILNNFNGIVVLDEAYIDFSKSESLLNLIRKYNNLIISQTFSKAWGLASVRVGIAYADEEIIRFYNKVKPPYNVSGVNQKAVLEAMDNEYFFMSKSNAVNTILEEKERVKKEISQIDAVQEIYPSDTNFLLVKVKNANALYNDLLARKIITRNRHTQVPNSLRISIGTPEENNELINALKQII